MKNTIFLAFAALLFTATVQAQSTVDSIAAKYKLIPMPEPLTIEKTFPVLGTYQLNTGADASVTTATSANVSTTTNAGTDMAATTITTNNVVVTLDPENKGMIWVEGLPQGKFKAYLKKSPATYRVLAQKTETGNSIPEGTLMFEPETKTLSIALGKDFDDADPAAIFALNPAVMGTVAPDATATADADNTVKVKVKSDKSKSKAKVTYFTATKLEQTTTATDATAPATAPATQEPQQQPAQQ